MKKYLPFFLFSVLLFSCTTDSYEKGEGKYSLMQADFCELTINGSKQGVSFLTDDGDNYQFTVPVTAKWIETADTTYRAIVYYNKAENFKAEAMALGGVATLHPIAHWRLKEQPQDPLGYESAWVAKNRKYLNVGLLVKIGRIEDEEPAHNIGLAQDTVLTHADGSRTAYYRLLHDQNDAPEYYTNRRYISIILPQPVPDTIHLELQTYDGPQQRTFIP